MTLCGQDSMKYRKQNGVSHDTLVQEKNYPSHAGHIWQGDTPKITARVIRRATSAGWDHPQISSWGNAPLTIGYQDTYRDPEGSSTPLLKV